MKYLISVVGTTGIGKTKLAIDLAKYFDTEIISCDSRQFFKEMPIGTAAPTKEEMGKINHHFIGNLSVEDYYSIGQFEVDALSKLDVLYQKKNIIIMVGGSMMYEKAVIEGLHHLPEANVDNQKKLHKIWTEEGLEKIQLMLKELDEAYYSMVDIANPRRLLRAIDVIWQTGERYSTLINEPKAKRNYETIRIGIEAPREIIYNRINQRVDHMIENGLLDEANSIQKFRNLHSEQELSALKTVGYTELFNFFDGVWDLKFAISEIKKNSRRFAKRQLTWYRGEKNIHWVNYKNPLQESLSLLSTIL